MNSQGHRLNATYIVQSSLLNESFEGIAVFLSHVHFTIIVIILEDCGKDDGAICGLEERRFVSQQIHVMVESVALGVMHSYLVEP